MNKFFLFESCYVNAKIIEIPLFTYLHGLPEEQQFIVYHIEQEIMKDAFEKYKTGKKISSSFFKCDNYLLTNDRKQGTYKICDYNDIEKNDSYLIKGYEIHLVAKKAFVHETGSYRYARGLQIYTTKTYEDIIKYFQNRQMIYEEIVKEINIWPEEKKKIFQEMYTPIQTQLVKK